MVEGCISIFLSPKLSNPKHCMIIPSKFSSEKLFCYLNHIWALLVRKSIYHSSLYLQIHICKEHTYPYFLSYLYSNFPRKQIKTARYASDLQGPSPL